MCLQNAPGQTLPKTFQKSSNRKRPAPPPLSYTHVPFEVLRVIMYMYVSTKCSGTNTFSPYKFPPIENHQIWMPRVSVKQGILATPVPGRHRGVSRSYFVGLSLTPTGSIHQNFGRIRSATTDMCFSPISRVLACCLLAKPVRSILDTNESYKRNTGSTSLVNTKPIAAPYISTL